MITKVIKQVLFIFLLSISGSFVSAQSSEGIYASTSMHNISANDFNDLFYKVDINKTININLSGESLQEALDQISRKAGLYITYRNDLLSEKKVVLKSEEVSRSEERRV